MKTLKTVALAVAMLAGTLASGAASADLIFNGTYAGANTFVGTYNPTASDSGLFSEATLGVGAFADTWIFSLSPTGRASVNANFIPGAPDPLSITGFNVSLYNVSAATCGVAGTTCSSVTLGSLIASGIAGANSSNVGFTTLTAGNYAFVVSGTVVSTPTLYSGQLTTRAVPVPEPGTLALAALGLIAAGGALRRRS